MAVANKVIEKAGAWYSYGEERIGQGRENVKIFFKNNSEIAAEIRKKVAERAGLSLKKDEKKMEKMEGK